MLVFGKAALIGLCVGLIWGVGCALVLLYSIYLAGYRSGVKDSLKTDKSRRFEATSAEIRAQSDSKRAGRS